MSLKVIGAGMHRTGTLSTKVALERLGFGTCFHGFEYIGRTDQLPYWREAVEKGGEISWQPIFGGYQVAFDWPMIYFWDKVVAAYPDAKVLLTYRDPESWYDSHAGALQALMQADEAGTMPVNKELKEIALGAMSLTFSDRLFDKDHCIEVFNRHYARVREAVPPERLLVYSAADGWAPLCRFLGIEAPDEPFPRVNSLPVFTENAYRANTRTRRMTDGMPWL